MSSYPHFVRTSRSTQIGCVAVQILSLYASSEYLRTVTFVCMMALCLYNLLMVTKRWYGNIDGRFDLQQFLKESKPQLKLQYALEVFAPSIVGIVVFWRVNLRGRLTNFIWTLASCTQITAAVLLLIMEFYEVFVVGY